MATRARTVSRLLATGAGNVEGGGNLTISDILPLLTTANVVETSNLYYTNLRVFSNLENASISIFADIDDNVVNANVGEVLIFDGNVWYSGTLVANTDLGALTTDDLQEGNTNLYFTETRSRFAISAANPTIIYDRFTGEISANLEAVAASANTTDTLPEGFTNKYFTNARVVSNVQTLSINTFVDVNVTGVTSGKVLIYDGGVGQWVPGDNVFSAVIAEEANTVLQINNFSTDDLREGSNNLYFTNTRVELLLSNAIANLSINDLSDVNTEVGLQTEYFLSWDGSQWRPRSISNVSTSINADFSERSNLANLALYAYYSGEANVANTALYALLANIANQAAYATLAGVAAFANIAANATYAEFANTALNSSTLTSFTTDDLAEGSNNLYYTDARVFANISQTSINIHNDVDIDYSNVVVGDTLTWSGTRWYASNTTAEAAKANFAETSNVANLVLSLSNFDTDDLTEGSTNQYYLTSRVSNDIYDILRTKNIEVVDLNVLGNLTVQGFSAIFDVDEFKTQSKTLVIADGAGSSEGAGIYWSAGANASITYSALDDRLGVDKNLVVHGNILPAINGEFSIGDRNRFWRSIYIGGQTIFLGNLALSEKPGGGLQITDTRTGELAEVGLSNVVSIESVTVDRIQGNVSPAPELRSYIGGNVQQFTQGETGNLYVGILKGSNVQQFAGMRVIEKYTGANVDSYAVGSLTIVNGGNGYSDGNVFLSFIGGAGGKGASANVQLDANGSIVGYTLLSGGYWYEAAPTIVIRRANLFGTENFTNAIITSSLDIGNIISKPRIESEVIIANEKEGDYLSTERISVLGSGNVNINASNVNITVKANSNVTINNDPVVTYNPLGQSLGLLRAAIEAPTGNVLYVSIDGDDNNSGTALSNSLANLHTALARANAWTTIFLKSGDHVLHNQPVTIKARVGIVGDNLRTTTVRPSQANVDMFYVENASYVTGITFRDHVAPAAVFSYNPDGSAGIITTSPYIQNCSSITGTGTGMRVDGAYVQGLRSMVCDSYTQTNSGGIGIHMLNRGYTQLVSVFTITCNIAILAERGGFCSITNSNSSFGTYGLVARGVSDPLYYGKFGSVTETDAGQQIVINNLSQKPNYGDVLIIANYNQDKCARDTGLIVDSIAIDLAYDSNTQSNFAGLQYWAQSESAIPNQSVETLDAIEYAKNLATNVIQSINITPDRQANVSQVFGIPGTRVANINSNFELIANIISGGTIGVTDRIIPNGFPPTNDSDTNNSANLLIANKAFIQAETIAYVNQTYPGFWDNANNFVSYSDAANIELKCWRDVGYIIDCISFDLLHGGNRQSIQAGVYYYNFNANVTQIENQIQATSEAYDFIGSIIGDIIHGNIITQTYQTQVSQNVLAAPHATDFEVSNALSRINLITNIIENGPSVAEEKQPIAYLPINGNVENAVKLILANRDFIVAEVTSYVNANWANITNNTAQEFYTVSNSTPLVGNTCNVTLLELVDNPAIIFANATISFHQPSYISASGHTFEYVGSGDELATALPYNGGMPIQENEVIESQGGRVYFTSTDQQGDFRIGTELTINRVDGTITGRTFNKSLFSVMTPYILAIEG
jgi:hypothetical protein